MNQKTSVGKKVMALFDSGAFVLALPQHLVTQLGLDTTDQREAELTDSILKALDIVGLVEIVFEN